MLLNEAKQILEKQGYRVEPPKYWVVTFGSEDEANEEEYNFANEGGWDSVVNVERVGNKLYIEYNKNIVDVIDEWFGDKAEIITGTELADVGDLGYIGESKTLTEAINNPDEPASKKQLWALYCITKQDWRDKNLTKGEASELIQKYSSERTIQNKEALTVNSIKKDIIQNLKPKLDKQMEKAFGNQSVVGDADLEGNLIPGGKRYKFFGSGCGWAWVKYDKRNKKLGEVLDKYYDIYRDVFFEKFANEYIKKYKERELGAVLSQDIDIQCIIKQAALDYAKSIGINTKGAYVESRLD